MLNHLVVARAQLKRPVDLGAHASFSCWVAALRRRWGI